MLGLQRLPQRPWRSRQVPASPQELTRHQAALRRDLPAGSVVHVPDRRAERRAVDREYYDVGAGTLRELAQLKIRLVGLRPTGGQVPAQLVGRHGQARRLARALALDPALLFSTSRPRAWTRSRPPLRPAGCSTAAEPEADGRQITHDSTRLPDLQPRRRDRGPPDDQRDARRNRPARASLDRSTFTRRAAGLAGSIGRWTGRKLRCVAPSCCCCWRSRRFRAVYSETGDRRSYQRYEIYFDGSVFGLSEGGSVRYLGVAVGAWCGSASTRATRAGCG